MNALFTLATLQAAKPPNLWAFGVASAAGLSAIALTVLYLAGWHKKLAERASRRGLGSANGLRWTIASQYQLPLGTFLGIAALLVVYFGPTMMRQWSQLFV